MQAPIAFSGRLRIADSINLSPRGCSVDLFTLGQAGFFRHFTIDRVYWDLFSLADRPIPLEDIEAKRYWLHFIFQV